MADLIINQQIAALRKNKGITQEELASHLGVTNQTVSKWELAACCPDIQLLPDIADYFNVSINELFGRDNIIEKNDITVDPLPWDDDDTIRAVVYIGKRLMEKTDDLSEFTFTYTGEAKNVECKLNISCGDIQGNAYAGCDVSCDTINGDANAGCDITCDSINGNVDAGCDVSCDTINGNAEVGCNITCTHIGGDVNAGCNVSCKTVNGSVNAGGNITYSN